MRPYFCFVACGRGTPRPYSFIRAEIGSDRDNMQSKAFQSRDGL